MTSEPRCFRHTKFGRCAARILKVLENVEAKNAVENFVTKRKAMCVADDVCVAEDLMLEFDAIRISCGGRASADVSTNFLPSRRIIWDFGTEGIALVFGWNNRHGLRQKQDSLIAHLKRARTIFAC